MTRELEANVNVLIFSIAGALSSGTVRGLRSESRFSFTVSNVIFLFLTALTGYGHQYTLNESIRLEKNTNILAIISSTSILISYLLDIFFMGTPFDWTSLIGSIIVFTSVALIVIYNKKT